MFSFVVNNEGNILVPWGGTKNITVEKYFLHWNFKYDHLPSVNNQQPQLRDTISCKAYCVTCVVCNLLNWNTGCWYVCIHVQYVNLYKNILHTDLHNLGGCMKIWPLLKGQKNTKSRGPHKKNFPLRRDQIDTRLT